MRFAILGSGAVGGYYGAQLSRAGHQVTFLARGPHRTAIAERGLLVWSPLGDFLVRADAEADPARIGVVEAVIVAVKTYDNRTALPLLGPLVGADTVVLTLQNGVDSPEEVATVVGEARVLAGATYVATALALPGLIEQTGTHRRIVLGEVFGDRSRVSARAERLRDALAEADIEVEAVADARVPLWEKFIYLAPFAGFTGAARLPIGWLWADPDIAGPFVAAAEEVRQVALAEGVAVSPDVIERMRRYMDELPAATRSSLLIDLSQGKPIEVEALQGAVARRGSAAGVATPVMSTLYSVLKPHASGPRAA
jgi:2-dehydropantoate 2-reductase